MRRIARRAGTDRTTAPWTLMTWSGGGPRQLVTSTMRPRTPPASARAWATPIASSGCVSATRSVNRPASTSATS